jgi:diacylglycerol kinase family enzyme
VFVNNASVGLDATIVRSPEYRDAKRATVAAMLPDLLGPGATDLDLRFTGPDGRTHRTVQVILVGNNPYQLHGVAGRGTRERIDGGELGIVAAQISTARDLSAFLALEVAGRPRRFAGWLEWTAPTFRVDSGGPVEVGIDGEAMTFEPPLDFALEPQALRVRVPRHSAARSPQARAVRVLSRSTLAQLAHIATGHPPTDNRP